MTDKIQQILKLLDLSEQDFPQKAAEWVREHQIDRKKSIFCKKCGCRAAESKRCRFPDPLYGPLEVWAFKLRDEVAFECENYFAEAFWLVYEYITGAKDKALTSTWFHCVGQPKHWIVAAIIAKEMAKEKK